jgi:hypothetical protein
MHMTVEMTRFNTALDRTAFQSLNGKVDPFDLLSSVESNIGDADSMMRAAGIFGWQPEMIPLTGMDGQGNFYETPANTRAIVVPQFPGGPAYFGIAAEKFPFLRPEAVVPLVDAIVAHGNPLTGIQPGPVTRYFFDSKVVDLVPYSAEAVRSVGEIIRFRWQLDLGNTGSASLKIGQKGMRLWCANGCTTAVTMGSVSISHSNLAPAKIEATVQRILAAGNLGLDHWIADARQAINTKLTLAEAHQMWAELFKWEDDKEGRAATVQENQEARLTELWRSNTQTVTFPDTAWAFFNATTEYLDHEAVVRFNGGTRQQALARRVVEGSPAVEAVKTRAWEMALAAR